MENPAELKSKNLAPLEPVKDASGGENVSVEGTNQIHRLVELMRTVDINSPEAKLNATTISDGKGGRILL